MRVLVLGGDGACGWPVSLDLSAAGHDVAVADNFARRGADAETGQGSVTPIRPLGDRVAAWARVTGRTIGVHRLDVAQDHDALRDLLAGWRPAAVVHLAQQGAPAYSMRSAAHKRYTVDNDVSATHNLLAALAETGVDAHVLHLGTTGGGSVAHLTKALGEQLLAFAARTDGVRTGHLRLGAVWGAQTACTRLDEALVNRFDVDEDHGGVLHRLCVQAVLGQPLLVRGTGDRAHALVHVTDAVAAVRTTLERPPARGDGVVVADVVGEVRRELDLALAVQRLTGAPIEHVDAPPDPRDEGLVPTSGATLTEERLEALLEDARRHGGGVDPARLAPALG